MQSLLGQIPKDRVRDDVAHGHHGLEHAERRASRDTLTMSRTSASNNVGRHAWETAMSPTHKGAGTVVAPKARDVKPATAATAASKIGAAADGARSDANPTAGANSTEASGTKRSDEPRLLDVVAVDGLQNCGTKSSRRP